MSRAVRPDCFSISEKTHATCAMLSAISAARSVAGSAMRKVGALMPAYCTNSGRCENRQMTTLNELSIQTPDDWHLHIRDGAAMAAAVPYPARQFGRAIIMPNLRPPITTTAQAVAYRERILAALPEGSTFEPLMTLYLTDTLPPDEIKRARDAGIVAVKLYPAGATTNSDAGVTDLRKTYKTLEAMQREGIKLLVHGGGASPDIDLFDREAVFIDDVFEPLRRDLPELKVVFEHITTKEAAQYVAEADAPTAATI